VPGGAAAGGGRWRGVGVGPAPGGLWLAERDGGVRGGRSVQHGAGLMEERLIWRRESDRFLRSLQFFTRIPIPASVPYSEQELNHAVIYFPLIGTLIGALCAGVFLDRKSVV